MNNIYTRVSIRKYQDKTVESEKTEAILRAAMQAPSAANQQPWEFYVVTDKAKLESLSKASPYAGMTKDAPVAIVSAYRKDCAIPQYAEIDLSIAMDIPDDWGQEYNLGLYEETFDAAIRFQKEFPETLWCYGNHDLSYEWLQYESGFSSVAIPVVQKKLSELRRELPDRSQMAYIHRIDDVLFLHGGLTHAFVKYYANDVDYDDTDGSIQ